VDDMADDRCIFYKKKCPVIDCDQYRTPDRCAFYAEMIRKYSDPEIDDNGFLLQK